MMSPLPSISQAYALIIQEEKQREIHVSSQFISESASMVAMNNQFKDRSDSKQTVICSHCKKPGHPASKCYRLIGFPKDFKFTKGKAPYNGQRMAANAQMDHEVDCNDSERHEENLATFPSVLPGFT